MQDDSPNLVFDRDLLRLHRCRRAASAASYDFLLARVADDFAERLSIITHTFPVAVNLGAHHGLISRRVAQLPNIGLVISADASLRLLEQCPGPRVLADEEALPFGLQSLNLVLSGLALQFVNDLPGCLHQIRQSLRPDGLLLATLLGGATLHELRHAWLVAEAEVAGGVSPRVAPFADVRDLGALLQRAGFALPVVDSETLTVTYPSGLALMQEIRGMGASNVLHGRRRQPVTRRLLARACQLYDELFATPDGRVSATFELITLTAWAPHDSQQKPLRPGSAQQRLADFLGVEERRVGDRPERNPDTEE